MDEKDFSALEHWINQINARGIAGSGARKTDQDKQIVEKSIMCKFSETVLTINQLLINNIASENPPLPDFSCVIGNNKIHIELTEFIDEELIKEAKRNVLGLPLKARCMINLFRSILLLNGSRNCCLKR